MSITAKQPAAVVLALTAVFAGVWATAAPRSFFTSFPLPGHHRVAALPPFNEHLTRDVGGLCLALFVVSAWSAARPRRDTQVAEAVGRTPDAVRQLAARARAHLRDRAPRFPVDPVQHQHAVTTFLAATAGGQLADLVAILDPEVTLTSDGGGQVTAARRPVSGADRVARFLMGVAPEPDPAVEIRIVDVNGFSGVGVYQAGQLAAVISLTTDGGRVTRVDIIRAPGKLLRWQTG